MLRDTGRVDDAIAALNKAIELNPKLAAAHGNLGRILCDFKGDYDGAIACFRAAMELNLRPAAMYHDLGLALSRKGRFDDAIASYKQAIAVNPKHTPSLNALGRILCDEKRDYDGAITCFRAAVELNPKSAVFRSNLGDALAGKGQLEGAIASFQKAIELDPKYAAAQTELAKVQRLAAVREKVAAMRNGGYTPASNEERLGLLEWCRIQNLHLTLSRLYADVFAADPKLALNLEAAHRYKAACSAALAAAGKGADAAELDEQEHARLRKLALGWLQADLAARTKQLETAKPPDRAKGRKQIRHWQDDADLAGVRDRNVLGKLPEAERKEWEALWAEVQALIGRTGKESR